jgi:uncharacterized membrane protein
MSTPTPLSNKRPYRLSNIDMLRGLAIVLMAIDHTRDMVMLGEVLDPMTMPNPSPELYLTRWITHFCAPIFVLLAGTSAGLMATRKPKNELAVFLGTRGLWLIFVEVCVISTIWTVSPFSGLEPLGGSTLVVFQVIWAIGASMIALAGFQYLGVRTCFILGSVILLGHNLVDPFWPIGDMFGGTDPMWYGLHSQASFKVGHIFLIVGYPIIPWIGVMLFGFGTASVFQKEAAQRDRILLMAGLAMIAVFFVLRAVGLYGDPNPWQSQPEGSLATALDFMNVTKYPPSLLFMLITCGPMIIICSLADRMSGWFKDTLVMFGRVPFAFYIAHWALLRVMSLILAKIQGVELSSMLTFFHFFPADYGLSLPGVFGVWVLVLVILYPFCRWVAEMKARRRDWWLSYL